MNAQQRIFKAVSDRGYTRDWTDGQFAGRQVVKLVEELAEAAKHLCVHPENPGTIRVVEFFDDLAALGEQARAAFDDRDAWHVATVEVDDVGAYRKELADCQVVLCCAGEVASRLGEGPFDVVAEAVSKALSDRSRGIRGGEA